MASHALQWAEVRQLVQEAEVAGAQVPAVQAAHAAVPVDAVPAAHDAQLPVGDVTMVKPNPELHVKQAVEAGPLQVLQEGSQTLHTPASAK